MSLGLFFLGFILLRTFCAFWTWLTIPFPMLGELSVIITLNIFLGFLSRFSFCDPYNENVGVFNVVPEVS